MLPYQTLKNEMMKAAPTQARVGEDAVRRLQELLEGIISVMTHEAFLFAQHTNRTTIKGRDILLAARTTGVLDAYNRGRIQEGSTAQ